jgi:outer membrane receptor for monomeric catechols
LALFSRFNDILDEEDSAPKLLGHSTFINPLTGVTNEVISNPALVSLDYHSDLEAYSGELQHFFQTHQNTLIFGGRFQAGWNDTHSQLDRALQGAVTDQDIDTDLSRVSVYAYEHWQILEPLQLSAGVSYDHLHYPKNIDTSPITSKEDSKDQVSPKAGLLYTPLKDTRLRAMYSQSLGGVFFDNSVRLEPTQISGFNQAFRSAIPESVVGLVPGTRFEAWGVGLDQVVRKTRSYLTVEGQFLNSDASRTVGVLVNSDINNPVLDTASSTHQTLDYREQALIVAFNQLLFDEWALGARYKMTHADLDGHFGALPTTLADAAGLNQDVSATLHQLDLYAIFNHRCGFFARFDAIWSQQSNVGYSPDIPGDDFWQYNVAVGYRFLQRRAEVRLALLNISDRDYRLNPLTLYNELPRERTLTAGLKFYF